MIYHLALPLCRLACISMIYMTYHMQYAARTRCSQNFTSHAVHVVQSLSSLRSTFSTPLCLRQRRRGEWALISLPCSLSPRLDQVAHPSVGDNFSTFKSNDGPYRPPIISSSKLNLKLDNQPFHLRRLPPQILPQSSTICHPPPNHILYDP